MQGSLPKSSAVMPSSMAHNHLLRVLRHLTAAPKMVCDCMRTPNQVAQRSADAGAGAATSGFAACKRWVCQYWEICNGTTHPLASKRSKVDVACCRSVSERAGTLWEDAREIERTDAVPTVGTPNGAS